MTAGHRSVTESPRSCNSSSRRAEYLTCHRRSNSRRSFIDHSWPTMDTETRPTTHAEKKQMKADRLIVSRFSQYLPSPTTATSSYQMRLSIFSSSQVRSGANLETDWTR